MHYELSYGLSIAPKLQRIGSLPLPGQDQPTPDLDFSQQSSDLRACGGFRIWLRISQHNRAGGTGNARQWLSRGITTTCDLPPSRTLAISLCCIVVD